MDGQIKPWLYDILKAIDEIDVFFGNGPKRFADYRDKLILKRAVERNITIIGEATNRILRVDPDFSITAARKIVDTRNRVSHGYDSVSDETMWGIVVNSPPILKAEVEKLLAR